jgi:hypothetical protein
MSSSQAFIRLLISGLVVRKEGRYAQKLRVRMRRVKTSPRSRPLLVTPSSICSYRRGLATNGPGQIGMYHSNAPAADHAFCRRQSGEPTSHRCSVGFRERNDHKVPLRNPSKSSAQIYENAQFKRLDINSARPYGYSLIKTLPPAHRANGRNGEASRDSSFGHTSPGVMPRPASGHIELHRTVEVTAMTHG